MRLPSLREDGLVDLVVTTISLSLLALLILLHASGPDRPSDKPDPAAVHAFELRAIAQDASAALPAQVREAIGLEGQPLATRRGLLEDLARDVDVHPGLRLLWTALAVGWGEDEAARKGIVTLSTAEGPSRFGTSLDDLTRIANGRAAVAPEALAAELRDLGGSRWLTGLIEARQRENAADPAATETRKTLDAIATEVSTRQAIFFALQVALLAVGLFVIAFFPFFIRPRLLDARRVRALPTSPFRADRTARVLLAWFVGFQVAGFVIFGVLGSGPQASAYAVPLGGLTSGVIALALIELWGREPSTLRPLRLDLGLTLPERPGPLGVLLWLLPAMGLCALLTWLAELVNRQLLGVPTETQSTLKLLLSEGDTLTLSMVGLGAVIVAPLVEELLFRAYLFRNLRDRFGSGLAVLASGLVFAAVHAHPSLILPLTGLGIALALVYEWTGSIWVPIAAHAAWNLMTLITVEATWRI